VSYLEQFARNKGDNEETIVVTARFPKSLYHDFKTRCDSYGIPVSEAIRELVKGEMNGFKGLETATNNELATTIEREPTTQNTPPKNTKRIQSTTNKGKTTTKATTKQIDTTRWQVDKEIPCPICQEWFSSTNFSKHAKNVHESTRIEIFSNEENKDMANTLYFGRTGKEVK